MSGLNTGAIMGCPADIDKLSMTTATDPLANAATSATIVGAYAGVIITTTGPGNSQTLGTPTDTTAGKVFTVVNNDTSTNTVPVVANSISYTIAVGTGQSFIWDGSKWMPTSMGITAIPVEVAQGGTGLAAITDHCVMLGSGTGAVTPLTALTNGQLIKGVTGGDPTPSTTTLTDGTNTYTLACGTGSLVVEAGNSIVNQDLTTDASPTFASVSATLKEEIEPATDNISADQCRGSIINNYEQADNAVLTLPAIAAGMHFTVILGTTVAKYFRIAPNTSDSIYLDGVTTGDGKYVGVASAAAGNAIQFVAFQTGASAWDWFAATVSGAWVAEA